MGLFLQRTGGIKIMLCLFLQIVGRIIGRIKKCQAIFVKIHKKKVKNFKNWVFYHYRKGLVMGKYPIGYGYRHSGCSEN